MKKIGAPPAAMVVCYDKAIVHLVAEALGMPVPAERFVPAHADLQTVEFPLRGLIKQNTGGGSVGITARAVVRSRDEA